MALLYEFGEQRRAPETLVSVWHCCESGQVTRVKTLSERIILAGDPTGTGVGDAWMPQTASSAHALCFLRSQREEVAGLWERQRGGRQPGLYSPAAWTLIPVPSVSPQANDSALLSIGFLICKMSMLTMVLL